MSTRPSNLLQTLRQTRHLSLRGLAQKAGVNASTLSRWESGQRQPSIPELDLVLKALNASDTHRRELLAEIAAPRAVRSMQGAVDGPAGHTVTWGGDLLRAMRGRKGWTQAQVSKAIGVTQTQISRWENGDVWPEAKLLHSLCWQLGASREEAAALTVGAPSAVMHPGFGVPLPEISAGEEQWRRFLFELMHHPPPPTLLELVCVATQHRIRVLAARNKGAAMLLADAYAIHARHLMNRQKISQAAFWAERGMATIHHVGPPPRSQAEADHLWIGNILVVAENAAANGRPAGVRRAIRSLREWLPHAKSAEEYHGWFLSYLAKYHCRCGEYDAAEALSAQACLWAARSNIVEHKLRILDRARLMLQINPRYVPHVLETLNGYFDKLPPDLAFMSLLEAESHIALGNRRGADAPLRTAEKLINEHDISESLPHWQRLVNCL